VGKGITWYGNKQNMNTQRLVRLKIPTSSKG
jgi:hypothetical protein